MTELEEVEAIYLDYFNRDYLIMERTNEDLAVVREQRKEATREMIEAYMEADRRHFARSEAISDLLGARNITDVPYLNALWQEASAAHAKVSATHRVKIQAIHKHYDQIVSEIHDREKSSNVENVARRDAELNAR